MKEVLKIILFGLTGMALSGYIWLVASLFFGATFISGGTVWIGPGLVILIFAMFIIWYAFFLSRKYPKLFWLWGLFCIFSFLVDVVYNILNYDSEYSGQAIQIRLMYAAVIYFVILFFSYIGSKKKLPDL